MVGLSLHVGINQVDKQAYYPLHIPDLLACKNDALAMQKLADKIGYQTSIIQDEQATYSNVTQAIADAAASLNSGDIFFLTYSGHGSQVLDTNGDETDGLDETWVLYDRQIIDDELYELWSKFKPGVRILVISDSCHSGTITKDITLSVERNLLKGIEKEKGIICQASGILISGCQDKQLSLEGRENGVFTSRLLEVWNNGLFQGSHRQLRNAIAARMPSSQAPNYFLFGVLSHKFSRQSVFAI
jgi:metacaspase-1